MVSTATLSLEVETRTAIGKGLPALRRQGIVPANVYGHGPSVALQIDEPTFTRQRELRRLTGLIELNFVGKNTRELVMVQHIAVSPGNGRVLHVDFSRVVMSEVVLTRVPLQFVGDSNVAHANNGVVIPLIEGIDIACLPADIPVAVTVDTSKITELSTILHAKDIDLPFGVTLRIHPEEPIAKVQFVRKNANAAASEITEQE